jgi:hypothetical protein
MKVPENFLYYLSAHADCNTRLLARAGEFTAQELEVLPNADAKRLRKMVFEVLGETHRMKAFVRLKPQGGAILHGYLKPRHKIAERVCDHFARRNPRTIIVLGNGLESWTALFCRGRIMREHGAGLTETLEQLGSALHDVGSHGSNEGEREGNEEAKKKCGEEIGKTSEEEIRKEGWEKGIDAESIWKAYYDSQYCPERKNLRVFRQRMPRRDQESAGLRLLESKENATLEDFF